MSSSADIRFYDNSYLNALKRGLKESTENYYDQDRYNSSSSDDEIQTRSKTAKKTARRNAKIATGRKKQNTTTTTAQQKPASPTPIVEKKQKQKKLTKRQQVLQRYADEESVGAASVLASIADAAVTRSQARNRNTVMWTENDRAAASRDAAIALEVATAAAEAIQGKKKKEQPAPYWTRLHEKSRSTVRFQKEMERVMYCDFY